jgi:hypothetical protein
MKLQLDLISGDSGKKCRSWTLQRLITQVIQRYKQSCLQKSNKRRGRELQQSKLIVMGSDIEHFDALSKLSGPTSKSYPHRYQTPQPSLGPTPTFSRIVG